ncbi:DUF3710 domain-containing protein [Pseudonocardia endophytica]|uniref:Uncharacterized protein DUF3710 n=1 Tax=Pseudonocardia endophytica TaxID=401976 RepID=A0A4R1HTV8_PSEEN|nr:DUF3710 domain-containing protein [Pseudonocardia endophytica]TCK24773.1 uncharacterized protein DUF3710 [Pseudonocardia endophytica]
MPGRSRGRTAAAGRRDAETSYPGYPGYGGHPDDGPGHDGYHDHDDGYDDIPAGRNGHGGRNGRGPSGPADDDHEPLYARDHTPLGYDGGDPDDPPDGPPLLTHGGGGDDRSGRRTNGKPARGRTGYDREGFDRDGFDREGFDRDGFDQEGFDRDGFDEDGYDRDGYPADDIEDDDRYDDGYEDDEDYDDDAYGVGDGPLAVPPPGRDGRPLGPADVEELDPSMTDALARIDLGSMQVPVPFGAEMKLEGADGGRPQAVHLMLPEGRIAVSALAAPRTSNLWPDLADEIEESLRGGGARVRTEHGDWGRELHARTENAASVFIGADGPRWMVYGVATAAMDTVEALDVELRRVMRGIIVVRGKLPYPPRTVLPLERAEDRADAENADKPRTASITVSVPVARPEDGPAGAAGGSGDGATTRTPAAANGATTRTPAAGGARNVAAQAGGTGRNGVQAGGTGRNAAQAGATGRNGAPQAGSTGRNAAARNGAARGGASQTGATPDGTGRPDARGASARNGAARGGIPNGAPANGAPRNGAPANGAPANGGPANGGPANGGPANGGPANGGPANAAPRNGTAGPAPAPQMADRGGPAGAQQPPRRPGAPPAGRSPDGPDGSAPVERTAANGPRPPARGRPADAAPREEPARGRRGPEATGARRAPSPVEETGILRPLGAVAPGTPPHDAGRPARGEQTGAAAALTPDQRERATPSGETGRTTGTGRTRAPAGDTGRNRSRTDVPTGRYDGAGPYDDDRFDGDRYDDRYQDAGYHDDRYDDAGYQDAGYQDAGYQDARHDDRHDDRYDDDRYEGTGRYGRADRYGSARPGTGRYDRADRPAAGPGGTGRYDRTDAEYDDRYGDDRYDDRYDETARDEDAGRYGGAGRARPVDGTGRARRTAGDSGARRPRRDVVDPRDDRPAVARMQADDDLLAPPPRRDGLLWTPADRGVVGDVRPDPVDDELPERRDPAITAVSSFAPETDRTPPGGLGDGFDAGDRRYCPDRSLWDEPETPSRGSGTVARDPDDGFPHDEPSWRARPDVEPAPAGPLAIEDIPLADVPLEEATLDSAPVAPVAPPPAPQELPRRRPSGGGRRRDVSATDGRGMRRRDPEEEALSDWMSAEIAHRPSGRHAEPGGHDRANGAAVRPLSERPGADRAASGDALFRSSESGTTDGPDGDRRSGHRATDAGEGRPRRRRERDRTGTDGRPSGNDPLSLFSAPRDPGRHRR